MAEQAPANDHIIAAEEVSCDSWHCTFVKVHKRLTRVHQRWEDEDEVCHPTLLKKNSHIR